MLRQCAWCGSVLGHTEPFETRDVTHGICIVCSIRMLQEAVAVAREQQHPAIANPNELTLSDGGSWNGLFARTEEPQEDHACCAVQQ